MVSCYEEEHKLQVFKNEVPRKIFVPRKDEASELFMVLQNKAYNLYRSPSIVRIVKCRRM
jgi:hypothetical protein